MSLMPLNENMSAGVIARFLKSQGVDRIFALCGGHIMPIWMRVDAEGIQIVDVRDERAAVYMAHAHSELTGKLGVALVTAGPGVTNAMTGIANAHVARASILVLSGLPPRQQENRGALQDIVHTDLVQSITRYARTVRLPPREDGVLAGRSPEPPAHVLQVLVGRKAVAVPYPRDVVGRNELARRILEAHLVHEGEPQIHVPPHGLVARRRPRDARVVQCLEELDVAPRVGRQVAPERGADVGLDVDVGGLPGQVATKLLRLVLLSSTCTTANNHRDSKAFGQGSAPCVDNGRPESPYSKHGSQCCA